VKGKTAMAKAINRLTAAQVDSLPPRNTPYSDGGNLYLDVQETGTRSWVFIFRWEGKQRTAGGGKAGKGGVSLKDARRWAAEGRELLNQKPPIDPRTVWRAPTQTSVKTFGALSNAYVDRQEERGQLGKSAKHRAQWRSTLLSLPAWFRDLPVDKVGPSQVFNALDSIWAKTPETGRRLRGRIFAVLDFARAPDDVRPNPAALTGWLKNRLGGLNDKIDRKTGERVERDHFAALPYADVPDFACRLRAEDGVAARALEFLLLTATRVSETRGAVWSEINVGARLWVIPPQRLKSGRKTRQPHKIPLSDRALAILEEMRAIATSDYTFNGRFDGQPLTT
jgi:integrase